MQTSRQNLHGPPQLPNRTVNQRLSGQFYGCAGGDPHHGEVRALPLDVDERGGVSEGERGSKLIRGILHRERKRKDNPHVDRAEKELPGCVCEIELHEQRSRLHPVCCPDEVRERGLLHQDVYPSLHFRWEHIPSDFVQKTGIFDPPDSDIEGDRKLYRPVDIHSADEGEIREVRLE